MHQHPELHIQLLLAQATLSDKAYGFPSVTQKAGSNTAQPGSWARWPAARGEDSLLIWLLQSSGWRRAAQDSWAHKRGDDSSQLGKLSTSPWKNFSIKSGNRKRVQRTQGKEETMEVQQDHSLVCWEALEVGYVQSNFSSPWEMKFLSTQAKYTILSK